MSDSKSKPSAADGDTSPAQIASKWNARYAYAKAARPTPADVLIKGAQYLPTSGIAIDIACGLGGNALYLFDKGMSVFAWDISSAAIDSVQEQSRGLQSTHTADQNFNAEVRDVVMQPPEPSSVDVIVVSRFLDRGLCPKLSDALRPNGVLFYQTFTAGLSNPDYLLAENELPALFASLTPCFTHEAAVDKQGFSEAQFIGRKG